MMREICAIKYFQETQFGLGKRNKLLRIKKKKRILKAIILDEEPIVIIVSFYYVR